jgi:hypothetical protein
MRLSDRVVSGACDKLPLVAAVTVITLSQGCCTGSAQEHDGTGEWPPCSVSGWHCRPVDTTELHACTIYQQGDAAVT